MNSMFLSDSGFLILLFCFSVSLVGTPIARELAHRFGVLDRPRAGATTKVHAKPTAYLGGVFVFVALAVGIIATLNAVGNIGGQAEIRAANLLAKVNLPLVFIAVAFIFFVGLTDDFLGLTERRAGMHPGVKMLLLAIGGTILFFAGVKVGFMPWDILNYPLTIFWILGITNAANVIDNMNGLSSGSGIVAGFFYLILGYWNSDPVTIGLAVTLIGTMLGFLLYNYPRASIFLGDSGSMTLGFYLSLLGLLAGRPEVVQGHALTGTLAPIFVLMFFVFDTWFVALSRGKRKINFWWGGLDHTSHRLNNLGFSKSFAVAVCWIFSILFGFVALVIYQTIWWFAILFALASFLGALRFWAWLNKVPIEEVDIGLLGAPKK